MKQLLLVALLIPLSGPAMAYVGPGLGMGVVGTIFGVLAAIVLAVFGLFWYPMKRAYLKKNAGKTAHQAKPVVAEIDANDQPDFSVQTQLESAAEKLPEDKETNHTSALNKASDSITVNKKSAANEASDPANGKRTESQAG